MTNILVVEDDLDIQALLKNFLEADGYHITIAEDGIEAITIVHQSKFDLILLDILLPKMDGYAVCELIRKESMIPIIMLTALDAEENQIRGLDLQADDYITKPFSMQVLLRKVAAVLRRTKEIQQKQTLVYEDLILDLQAYELFQNGRKIELTQREFELLKKLLCHQGQVLTRQVLLESLWEYDFYGDDRVVDTHIKNIRKKISKDYIKTVRGVGYRIDKKN